MRLLRDLAPRPLRPEEKPEVPWYVVLTLHEDGTQEHEEYGHDDSKPNIEKEVPILMVQPGGDVCIIQEFLPEDYTEAIKLQEHFDQLKKEKESSSADGSPDGASTSRANCVETRDDALDVGDECVEFRDKGVEFRDTDIEHRGRAQSQPPSAGSDKQIELMAREVDSTLSSDLIAQEVDLMLSSDLMAEEVDSMLRSELMAKELGSMLVAGLPNQIPSRRTSVSLTPAALPSGGGVCSYSAYSVPMLTSRTDMSDCEFDRLSAVAGSSCSQRSSQNSILDRSA